MWRTTDTGGVKMIYNGVPTDGKCNNTGEQGRLGTSSFGVEESGMFANASLADVGYMYNSRTKASYKDFSHGTILESYTAESTNYYYGTGVTFSNGNYTLTNSSKSNWSDIYGSSRGLYTCRSDTSYTCSNVFYIVGGNTRNMYGFSLFVGYLVDHYDTNIVIGNSYTKSGNTYTLNDTTTIKKSDWFTNYSNYSSKYTCGDTSSSCTDANLRYIIYSEKDYYRYVSADKLYKYSNSFTYSGGTYTLSNTNSKTFWEMNSSNAQQINNAHYTCFNSSGTCTTLNYIFYVTPFVLGLFDENYNDYAGGFAYVPLTNGNGINDYLDDVLYADNINTNNSPIKTFIDDWYQANMTNYTSYLEDVIYCNDRNLSDTTGLITNGGDVTKKVSFVGYRFYSNYFSPNVASTVDLVCERETDQFSVANPKAKLTYPVALMTSDEANLLNDNYLRYDGKGYWLMTPNSSSYWMSYSAVVASVSAGGMISTGSDGVRPAISLKPDTEYVSGDGSMANPYVVRTSG